MAEFWDTYRNRVLTSTTAADTASMIYQKVASTGVMPPAITRPAYYLGRMSTLLMDFVNHVERMLNTPDENTTGLLRSVAFMRETCRSIRHDIFQVADPLERLLTMLEDVLEGEELAALEDETSLEATAEQAAAVMGSQAAEQQDQEEIEREVLSPNREKLEEAVRVKLHKGDFSEETVKEVASAIGGVYLECVQFARELDRLSTCPDEDGSTIMSILMDMQYGLDTQLRGLLMEDIDTSDFEPSYRLGFFVWTAHLVAELMDKLREEKTPAAPLP